MLDRIWFKLYKDEGGRLLIEPTENKDLLEPDNFEHQIALFQHCTTIGLKAVTIDYFNSIVAPLLVQHGIVEWDFIEGLPASNKILRAYRG